MKARLFVGLAVGTAVLPTAMASASTARVGSSVIVTPAATAWYDIRVGCSTALGCLPAPVSVPHPSFAPNTLHVGRTAGQETLRSYVEFDTHAIGAAKVRSGTIRLPIAVSLGTSSLGLAHVAACLANERITPHEGGPDIAPDADCTVVRIPLTVTGTASAPVLTGDLAPYLAFTGGDVSHLSLAIMVDPDLGGRTDTWHVVLDPTHLPITAHLQTTGGAGVGVTPPSSAPSSPIASAPSAAAATSAPAVSEQVAPTAAPAPTVQPPGHTVAEPKSARSGRADRYGVEWLAPLGAAGLLWLVWKTVASDLRSLAVRPRS